MKALQKTLTAVRAAWVVAAVGAWATVMATQPVQASFVTRTAEFSGTPSVLSIVLLVLAALVICFLAALIVVARPQPGRHRASASATSRDADDE